MNVLFVSPFYPSRTNSTAGIFVQEQVLAMRALGLDVRVVHLDFRLPPILRWLRRYRGTGAPMENVLVTPPWVLRSPFLIWPKGLGTLRQCYRCPGTLAARLRQAWPDFRPDVLHAHTLIPGALVARQLAEHWDAPFVITTHGTDTRRFCAGTHTRGIVLDLIAASHRILCVGDVLKALLTNAGADPDSVCVVYNGMDLAKTHAGPNPLRSTYAGKRVILALGNLKKTKGLDLLVNAVAKLRSEYVNLHVVIVGAGPYRRALVAQVRKLGLQSSVELTGPKVPQEAMAYMDACELFCLPSWEEGFGIVYLEAMAHGKPVIAVEGQGITNVVHKHGTGLLVRPRDVDAVASALRQLLDDTEAARAMGSKGRDLAHNEFSWKHNAERIHKIYQEALSAEGGSRCPASRGSSVP